MSKMCIMESCKAEEGCCIHEKILAVIVLVVILVAIANYLGIVTV